MINTKKDLQSQIDFLTDNAVYQWQIDQLRNQISTLQHVLIEAGILIDAKGVHKSLIVVDGEPYSIVREKK